MYMWMDWDVMGFFGWTMMILFWTAVLVVIINVALRGHLMSNVS
jgi:hypothetical protein